MRGVIFGVQISLVFWLVLWCGGRALARLDVPPTAPNLSDYAKRVELAAPCDAAPSPDTLMGSVGSAHCYVSRDATRPTVVQAANVMTGSDGTWAVTWARPFGTAEPVVSPLPINTGNLPMVCNVSKRSAAGASGRCWQATATTLPGVLTALVGLVVSPFSMGAPNAAVMVIGREPTQP